MQRLLCKLPQMIAYEPTAGYMDAARGVAISTGSAAHRAQLSLNSFSARALSRFICSAAARVASALCGTSRIRTGGSNSAKADALPGRFCGSAVSVFPHQVPLADSFSIDVKAGRRACPK